MAHPIYSFTDTNSKKRFYQIWDTVSGYASTIPIDFLTFLQFNGLERKEYIQAVHNSFPILVESGTTLINGHVNNLSSFLDIQTFQSIEFLYIHEIDQMDEISKELEELFINERDFDVFYDKYKNLIKNINPVTPYPLHYYKSWAYTSQILSYLLPEGKNIIENHLSNLEGKCFSDWVNLDYFQDKRDKMLLIFHDLAINNHIEIGAIPHFFRNEDCIKHLFKAYGMDNLLQEYQPIYNPKKITTFNLFNTFDLKFKRQFLNYFAFNVVPGGNQLRGKRLHSLNDLQINKLLNEVYIYNLLYNFKDENDNILYPFIYIKFDTDADLLSNFVFLDEYGVQSVSVFLNNGELIDESSHYDINSIENDSYIATTSNGSYLLKCIYNFENKTLDKNDVYIDSDGEEILENTSFITQIEKIQDEDFLQEDFIVNNDIQNFIDWEKDQKHDDLPF